MPLNEVTAGRIRLDDLGTVDRHQWRGAVKEIPALDLTEGLDLEEFEHSYLNQYFLSELRQFSTFLKSSHETPLQFQLGPVNELILASF